MVKRIILFAILLTIISIFYGCYKYVQHRQNNNAETAKSENIMATSAVATVQPTKNPETKILFIGDTMLARSVGANISKGIDPFENVKDLFSKYDLVIANLECVVGDKGKAISGKPYTLQAPVAAIDYLSNSGIKMVSLANNHTKDFGDEALLQTIELLDTAKIGHFGAGENAAAAFKGDVVDVNGTKIGFLAFNEIENNWTVSKSGPTSAWNDTAKITKELDNLKKEADISVVMPHWGEEYHNQQNSWQVKVGHRLIDAGASIIIGAHPHVVQGSELYAGKNIYYSLGNFVFDQMGGMGNATTGMMVEVTIKNKAIISTQEMTVKLGHDGRPTVVANP